jgi:hypothetical protein
VSLAPSVEVICESSSVADNQEEEEEEEEEDDDFVDLVVADGTILVEVHDDNDNDDNAFPIENAELHATLREISAARTADL